MHIFEYHQQRPGRSQALRDANEKFERQVLLALRGGGRQTRRVAGRERKEIAPKRLMGGIGPEQTQDAGENINLAGRDMTDFARVAQDVRCVKENGNVLVELE